MPAGLQTFLGNGNIQLDLTRRVGKFITRSDTNGQNEATWWYTLPPGAVMFAICVYSGGQTQDGVARPPHYSIVGNRLEWYYGQGVPAANKWHTFYVGYY